MKRRLKRPGAEGPTRPKLIKLAIEMGLTNIATPQTLEELSSSKAAAHFNSMRLVPGPGWTPSFECKFLSKLDPSLFIRYLRKRGGVMALKSSVSSVDYQLVLRHLWKVSSDYTCLPLSLRQSAVSQKQAVRRFVNKNHCVDHAFYRLGLTVLVFTEEEAVDYKLASSEIDLCSVSQFYSLSSRTFDGSVTVPACLAQYPELADWTHLRQPRFNTAIHVEDLKISRSKRSWTQTPHHVLLYLSATETAVAHARIQEAAAMASSLLMNPAFRSDSLVHYKLFVYSALAYCLAGFCCNYDFTFGILNRMLRYLVYPSDRQLFYLAKQRVYVAYGLFAQENSLFQMMNRDDPFLPQSGYLKQFLYIHHLATYRKCTVLLLETWCCKQESALLNKPTRTQEINKKYARVVQRSLRLQEVMNHYRGSVHVHEVTSNLIREVDYQCRLLRVFVTLQRQGREAARSAARLLTRSLRQIPAKLVCAFMTDSRRDECLLAAEDCCLDQITRLERLTDFADHPIIGIKGLEWLGIILLLGLEPHCPRLVRDLVDRTKRCLEGISVVQRHWALSLVERIDSCLRKDRDSLLNARSALGLTAAQQKASLRACSVLAEKSGSQEAVDLELESLLCFFNTRDKSYYSDIVTFGQQSIANGRAANRGESDRLPDLGRD